MVVPVYIFQFLIFTHLSLLLYVPNATGNPKCPHSFDCGNLASIGYPFTTTERHDCGLLAIRGCSNPDPAAARDIQLTKSGKWFNVTRIEWELFRKTIVIRDHVLGRRLASGSCEAFTNSIALPPSSPLASFQIKRNITILKCNSMLDVPTPKGFIRNTSSCNGYAIYYGPSESGEIDISCFKNCSMIQLPPLNWMPISHSQSPFDFLSDEIPIEVRLSAACLHCLQDRRGQCRLDSKERFFCAQGDKSLITKLSLGLALGLGGLLVVIAGGLLLKIRNKWKRQSPTNQMIESFLKKHGSIRIRRYSYSEIKKVTNSFQNKLGKGGYGTVYKGQLHDGRLVAVKMLAESKGNGNGEDFVNEVASISNTSHVNIVALLGFCFEDSKRALIYEFMPNGSLEKFIYEENINMTDHQLNCKTLYDIAIGVARGLEYLHKGCSTKILHFDIKPHNILLDEEFCPKISDFGLAKVCLERESIVSLTGTRGTIGYIAPEVFSRNFGGVSHKSDVYSYGMMILEIIGGRKNLNIEIDSSSDIYFSHWIYECLRLNQDLALQCIKNENDQEKVRKMAMVGLWCIQADPANRPAISKVVEMLNGSLKSLQMPPKPYFSSPSTSPRHTQMLDISVL